MGFTMHFRSWIFEIWQEHVEETLAWTGKVPEYTQRHYFARYKWWLKREYTYQKLTGFKDRVTIM